MSQDLEQQRTANVVLTADVDQYRQQVQAAGTDTAKLTTQVDRLTRSLDNMAKNAGKKLILFTAGQTAGVVASTVAFAAFEKQMTSLRVNASVTGRSYDDMIRSVDRMRVKFGVTTAAAAELNRVVLGFKDGAAPVQKLTDTFEKLGAAVGEAPDTLAQGMLQLQRSMGTSQRDTLRYSNVLTDLSVRSGVAAGSILSFSQAIAPIGRIAGMSQEAIMGVATAFNKSGQDGYLAANAFNKMLSDIMNSVQSGSPDLAKYANLIGVTADQFKSMDKTTAITDVFDELNRLGPNAIQILNRMGLDGMRMQKAIAGVSQQSGGIGTAIAQAVAAYNDGGQTSLNKGSAAAMDTVSERMSSLSESTKQFGETMGATVAGPAKLFLGALTDIARVATALAGSSFGKLAGDIAAMAAPLVLGTGLLLKFGSTLASIATGRVLLNNSLRYGVRDAWNQKLGYSARTPLYNTINDPEGNKAGPVATFLHRQGERIGGFLPAIAPGQPGYISRIAGAGLRGAGEAMDYFRGAYSPLLHPFNPGNRVRVFASDYERANGQGFGPGGIFSQSILTGRGPNAGNPTGWVSRSMYAGGAIGRRAAEAFLPSMYRSEAPAVFSGLGPNLAYATGKFGGMLGAGAGAAAGLGAVGVRAGAGLAIRGAAAGLGFLAANPLMALTMGIPLAMAAKQNISSANSFTNNPDALSFMNAYKVAVGDATSATTDFATALKDATKAAAPSTKHQAMMVSEQDKAQVMTPGYKYTDSRIKDVTRYQAQYLLQGQLGTASPAAIQALKLDLIKRFGAKDAESILRAAQANAGTGFDTARYMNQIADQSGGWGIKTDGKTKNEYELLGKQFDDMVGTAVAKGGSGAGGVAKNALVNQFLSSYGRLANDHGRLNDAEQSQAEDFLNKKLFGGTVDVGNEGTGSAHASNDLNPWNQYDINTGSILANFKKSRVAGLQDFYQQLLDVKQGKKSYDAVNSYLEGTGFTRKQIQAQVTAGKGDIFRMDFGRVNALEAGQVTGAEAYRARINATDAGKLFQSDKVVKQAIASPGDENAQIAAINEVISKMRKNGDSYSQIDSKLLKLEGTIGDTTDQMYKLAEGARNLNNRNLQYQLPYMSQADQYHAISASYAQKVADLAPGPGKHLPVNSQQQLQDAKDQFEQYQLGVYNTIKQVYIQQREFDIQKKRSDYDFYQVQLPRMQDQFNLSRSRAEEDYQLSRSRAEQQFNISRKDTLTDYNISRKRAEQDFFHQRDLMVKQAAQSEMNAYQRVFVQQTWSGAGLAGNLEDQNYRLNKQTKDLAKVKKMGLSKDAIQQLGFTDPANAQQLARFVEDAMGDPKLISRINKTIAQRLSTTKKLVTDSSNQQWDEMTRQYHLAMKRGEEDLNRGLARQARNFKISMDQGAQDFKRTMDRGEQDYNIALGNMKDDYTRMQDRAQADLLRFQHDVTMSFQQLLVKASGTLSGWMKTQVDNMLADYRRLKRELHLINQGIAAQQNKDWAKMPGITLNSTPGSRHGINMDTGTNPKSGTGSSSPTSLTSAQRTGKNMAAARGWTGNQWNALYNLWMKESGWSTTADNPGSSAYGIPQALLSMHKVPSGYYDHITGSGKDIQGYGGNASAQIQWGLNYIKSAYGSPEKAWAHELKYNWYGDGSVFTGPKVIGVGERGPEAVLPLNERGADFVASILRRFSTEVKSTWVSGNAIPMGGSVYNYRIDKSTNFTGPVQVHGVENPRELAEKARLEARRKKLTSGKAR